MKVRHLTVAPAEIADAVEYYAAIDALAFERST